MLDRCLNQGDGKPTAAVLLLDEEASDGPDFLIIHRLENARMGEFGVLSPRFDRHPAGGVALGIGKQAGGSLRIHDGLLHLAVAVASVILEGFAAQFPEHAPATAAGAALTEEDFEITP